MTPINITPLNEPNVKISKNAYKQRILQLRSRLLELQRRVKGLDKSVIIVVAGDDRSGRNETINALCQWMDPRFLDVNAYAASRHENDSRPFFWRFWHDTPKAGQIAIYLRGWTSTSIVQHLNGEINAKKLHKRETYCKNFEQKLLDSGSLIIKFWLHISEEELKARVKKNKGTPYFDKKDALALKNYSTAMKVIESTLKATSTEENPWHIVNGADTRHRDLNVAEQLASRLESWIDQPLDIPQLVDYPKAACHPQINMPDDETEIDNDKLEAKLKKYQARLRKQMVQLQKREIPVVIAFEGWDAAGKGGAIRRLVAPLDAGSYRICPIAAPTDEEKAHHYLWRFWRMVPRNGYMTIFDRSWYGRVLVERVEGFAEHHEWHNAYQEINDFEEQLCIHGTVLIKIWLNISKEEQLRRFKEREVTEHKKHKITEEDYRNRQRWDDYVEAIEDMATHTHTKHAPWTFVNSNQKPQARVEVLKAVTKAISQRLKK